jgi:2-haloacid dehalogenase
MTSDVLVFDVNETLLEMQALNPLFDEAFGTTEARREWFASLLLYAQVATLAGPYADFGDIAGATLTMTAERRGLVLPNAQRERILDGMKHLPAHADVPGALGRLATAGFRLVALSNSGQATLGAQLANAGLTELFERVFSVESVGRYKPAPEAYRAVGRELGVDMARLRMVAAHAWDIVGALRAGCAGAFVARPGCVWYPLAARPDVSGPDLEAIADQLIAPR